MLASLMAAWLAGCASGGSATSSKGAQPRRGRETGARPRRTAAWWFRAGAASAHAHGAGREQATNLILFLGDGMSLPTVAAARILEGQRAGGSGEEHRLAFEEFPVHRAQPDLQHRHADAGLGRHDVARS
jgi:alkaline phosphatase